jgi:LmbE family N-acetylglucosaminyl deacetylase
MRSGGGQGHDENVLVLVAHPDDANSSPVDVARFAAEGASALRHFHRRPTWIVRHAARPPRCDCRRPNAPRRDGALPPLMLGYWDLGSTGPRRVAREIHPRHPRVQAPVLIAEDLARPGRAPRITVLWPWRRSAVSFAMLPLMNLSTGRAGGAYRREKYFMRKRRISTRWSISATMEKLAALAQHATQMDFLVEDIRRQAQLAQLDIQSLLGAAAADPMLAVGWAMRSQAAEVGKPAGFEYGEAFRYARFHPFVEGLIPRQG